MEGRDGREGAPPLNSRRTDVMSWQVAGKKNTKSHSKNPNLAKCHSARFLVCTGDLERSKGKML